LARNGTQTSAENAARKEFTMREMTEYKHEEITRKILHAFYKIVYPSLGYGFLEKVY
jgi:hypothetical protein